MIDTLSKLSYIRTSNNIAYNFSKYRFTNINFHDLLKSPIILDKEYHGTIENHRPSLPYNLKFPNKINFNHAKKKKYLLHPFPHGKLHDLTKLKHPEESV